MRSSSVSRRWFFSTTSLRNFIAAQTVRLIRFFASRWMMIGEAMPMIPKSRSGLRKATGRIYRRGAEDAEGRRGLSTEVGRRFVAGWFLDEVVDDAGDAIDEALDVEVDDEAQTLVRKAQVGAEFRFVDEGDLLFGFEVEDDAVLDEQIEPQICGQAHAFVADRHSLLTLEKQPTQMQFVAQRFFIRLLD